METNDNPIQESLDSLTSDLRKFESELLPQIDELAKALPEIYAGYASAVRNIVETTLKLVNPKHQTKNRIALVVEVGTRSIQAYGEYKAAKEHNRLLQKYIAIKQEYATNNIEKVNKLLPKLKKSNSESAKLLNKCSEIEYQISQLDNRKITRIANIQLRALAIHRTNIYLLELCKYLCAEYKVWLSGMQNSDNDMPDYYLINKMLAEHIYGKNLLQAYSDAADETEILKGKQIMLLSDYQLSMMALGSQLCRVNLSAANPVVAKLITECGASEIYSQRAKAFANHIEKNPAKKVVYMGIIATLAIIFIAFFYLDNHDTYKWVLSVGGVAIVFRICINGYYKVLYSHVQEGIHLAESCDKAIETDCGKVNRPDIDYKERNALSAAINSFFK